jgi:hypothetical protein
LPFSSKKKTKRKNHAVQILVHRERVKEAKRGIDLSFSDSTVMPKL